MRFIFFSKEKSQKETLFFDLIQHSLQYILYNSSDYILRSCKIFASYSSSKTKILTDR